MASSQFFLISIFVSFTILFHLPYYFDYSNRHTHQSLEGLPRFPFKKVLAPEDSRNTLIHPLGHYLRLVLTYNY